MKKKKKEVGNDINVVSKELGNLKVRGKEYEWIAFEILEDNDLYLWTGDAGFTPNRSQAEQIRDYLNKYLELTKED